jgi:hypothetical protein
MHWHGPDLLSCRARAQHYRRYAAEIRAIAESKPAGLIRDQLLALARQYELLAAMVGGERRVTGWHAGGGPKLAIPETAAEAVSS